MTKTKPELTPIEQRAIALEALADPRTVARVLKGEPSKPLVKERIRRALANRGLAALLE